MTSIPMLEFHTPGCVHKLSRPRSVSAVVSERAWQQQTRAQSRSLSLGIVCNMIAASPKS